MHKRRSKSACWKRIRKSKREHSDSDRNRNWGSWNQYGPWKIDTESRRDRLRSGRWWSQWSWKNNGISWRSAYRGTIVSVWYNIGWEC